MKKAAQAVGIPPEKVFPHNLRHLFAREFYKQTRDIARLADVLGHSSIETTRIYIKSTGREHKEQLDRMDMIMSGNEKMTRPPCSANVPMVPEDGGEQEKSSQILLPQDVSLTESIRLSMRQSEKINYLGKIFFIDENLKKECDMIHNKYYVVNQNLQFVVYHSF